MKAQRLIVGGFAAFVMRRSGARIPGFAILASAVLLCSAATLLPSAVQAQGRPDPAALIAAQRAAMAPLAFMDGVWRGSAWTLRPDGTRHEIIQTERIGPFLDGSVKVIEGRGYDPDGRVTFNALGIVSYDPARHEHSMHTHALGRVGDFRLEPSADGYVWEIPAGPSRIRYTAVIRNGDWFEFGDRLAAGHDPLRFFEMRLHRIGDTDWPAGGAVPAK